MAETMLTVTEQTTQPAAQTGSGWKSRALPGPGLLPDPLGLVSGLPLAPRPPLGHSFEVTPHCPHTLCIKFSQASVG